MAVPARRTSKAKKTNAALTTKLQLHLYILTKLLEITHVLTVYPSKDTTKDVKSPKLQQQNNRRELSCA